MLTKSDVPSSFTVKHHINVEGNENFRTKTIQVKNIRNRTKTYTAHSDLEVLYMQDVPKK